jgi:hypothetical protein
MIQPLVEVSKRWLKVLKTVYIYPFSSGRDSIQTKRPTPAMANPPRRFSAPDTISTVIGDFQEPYGAVVFPAPVSSAAEDISDKEEMQLTLCSRVEGEIESRGTEETEKKESGVSLQLYPLSLRHPLKDLSIQLRSVLV